MATISPKVRARLDTLSPELRSAVLAQGRDLRTLQDLVAALDAVIREAEGQ